MEDLTGYQYLWDGTEDGWVLVLSNDLDSGMSHVIFNTRRQMMLMIEDATTSRLVLEEMLANGIEVLREMPQVAFRVENIEFEEQADGTADSP